MTVATRDLLTENSMCWRAGFIGQAYSSATAIPLRVTSQASVWVFARTSPTVDQESSAACHFAVWAARDRKSCCAATYSRAGTSAGVLAGGLHRPGVLLGHGDPVAGDQPGVGVGVRQDVADSGPGVIGCVPLLGVDGQGPEVVLSGDVLADGADPAGNAAGREDLLHP